MHYDNAWRWLCQTSAATVLGSALFVLSIQTGNTHGMDMTDGMTGAVAPEASFSFGEPRQASAADRIVNITMKEMSFEPASLDVREGETIRFVVRNVSNIDHDFTVGDTATQAAHRGEMAEMSGDGEAMHADPNAILVKAGETEELTWAFTRVGTFEFDCNVPGHYEAGMTGSITVLSR